MVKTINFCGDSFCHSRLPDSYTIILADMLKADILGLGQPGGAHETAIKTFDSKADYTVFCWTEPHRVYHKDEAVTMQSCNTLKGTSPFWDAGYNYFKYLHNLEVSKDRQFRDFYWFDREVLSKYTGKIIHMWSFKKTYNFLYGVEIEEPLIHLQNRGENLLSLNHLSVEHNKLLAEKLYKLLRS